jgi:hypothetical protein
VSTAEKEIIAPDAPAEAENFQRADEGSEFPATL